MLITFKNFAFYLQQLSWTRFQGPIKNSKLLTLKPHSSYSDVPNDIKLNRNISLQTLFIFGSRWFMIRKKEHRQRFKTGILSNETTKKKTFLESHVEKNSSREKRRKRYALLEAS